MNYLTGSGYKRSYWYLVAVENMGSALCCAGRQEVLLSTEQCQPAGSSCGMCSPCLTCCMVRAAWIPASVSGQKEEGRGGQLLTVVSGWISLLGKSRPGLVPHQWAVVVPTTIQWNRTTPNLFPSIEYLDHLGSKITLTLPWHRTCHLVWSVPTHCSKKKITSTYIAPGRCFSNHISGNDVSTTSSGTPVVQCSSRKKAFPNS